MRILLFLLMLLIPTQVFAGPYIKGNVGLFVMEDSTITQSGLQFEQEAELSMDTGFGLSAAIGASVNEFFSVELEYAYREADADEVEIEEYDLTYNHYETFSIKTLMANGIINLPNTTIFTPYFGAGLGLGWANLRGADNAGFAYQALAGLETEVSKNVSFLAGYRYLGTEDFTKEYSEFTQDEMTFDSHNIEVGLKYFF